MVNGDNKTSDRSNIAPVPTLRRLPRYLEYLKGLRVHGDAHVSCTQIAGALDLVPTQVRKDLACTGIVGKPKKGYPVFALMSSIENFLGWNDPRDAFLIGAGALGTAILGYESFRSNGLNIVAAFDTDTSKIGTKVRGVEVLALDKLEDLCRRMKILIGVLTMPAHYAQAVTDMLVRGGIKAIWNFTTARLVVPDEVVLENAQLASSFAVLSSKLRSTMHDPLEEESSEEVFVSN